MVTQVMLMLKIVEDQLRMKINDTVNVSYAWPRFLDPQRSTLCRWWQRAAAAMGLIRTVREIVLIGRFLRKPL